MGDTNKSASVQCVNLVILASRRSPSIKEIASAVDVMATDLKLTKRDWLILFVFEFHRYLHNNQEYVMRNTSVEPTVTTYSILGPLDSNITSLATKRFKDGRINALIAFPCGDAPVTRALIETFDKTVLNPLYRKVYECTPIPAQ